MTLAIEGSLLRTACRICQDVVRTGIDDEVYSLAALYVECCAYGRRKVQSVEVELALVLPIVCELSVVTVSLQYNLYFVVRVSVVDGNVCPVHGICHTHHVSLFHCGFAF